MEKVNTNFDSSIRSTASIFCLCLQLLYKYLVENGRCRFGVFVCIGFWSNRLLERRADKFYLYAFSVRLTRPIHIDPEDKDSMYL